MHLALSAQLLALVLSANVMSPTAPVEAPRPERVLIDSSQRTDLGELQFELHTTRRGALRGRLRLVDPATGTDVWGVIRGGTLRLRGSFRGERVRESHAVGELFEIDFRGREPELRPGKKTSGCPGKIGKLICWLGEFILAACAEDGEFLGIECGDGPSPDGGAETRTGMTAEPRPPARSSRG